MSCNDIERLKQNPITSVVQGKEKITVHLAEGAPVELMRKSTPFSAFLVKKEKFYVCADRSQSSR